MPQLADSPNSRRLAELLATAQAWGPTAARMAGSTPPTAALGEATAARLEGRTPSWQDILMAASIAAIPLGAVLGAAKRKGGSALGKILKKGKTALRHTETPEAASRAMYDLANSLPVPASRERWVQGQRQTIRAYRGGGDPVPGRGVFLSEDPADSYRYMLSSAPEKIGTPVQRVQQALRQYDLTVENPRVFPDYLEPEHAIRQARTVLESSVPTDLTMRQLEAAGITTKQVDAALRSKHPYREADKLMHRYLQKTGHDAALFPISGQIQLVEPQPRLPK